MKSIYWKYLSRTLGLALVASTTMGAGTCTSGPKMNRTLGSVTRTVSNTSGGTSGQISGSGIIQDALKAPKNLRFSQNSFALTVGKPELILDPTFEEGTPALFDIKPDLPKGLTFDYLFGNIIGTPSVAMDETEFTITAKNAVGVAEVKIKISVSELALPADPVDDDPSPSLNYSSCNSILVCTIGQPCSCKPTLVTTLQVTFEFAKKSTLPTYLSSPSDLEIIKGISMDHTTGVIGGTALEFLSKPLSAIVNAKNSEGRVVASSIVTLNLSMPKNTPFDYGGGLLTFPLGDLATEFKPTLNGSFDTFTYSPALPEGINLDSKNGTVSGTPKAFSDKLTTHVVIASDSSGKTPSAVTVFTLKLMDIPPLSLTYSFNQSLYVVGKQILPNYAQYKGGAAQFSSPCFGGNSNIEGLILDPSTAKISGTPTKIFDPKVCAITAQNNGGPPLTTNVTISVVNQLPTLGTPVSNRSDHTATLLTDGRVLIVGGSDLATAGTLKTAEIFDPKTGAFTKTGDMTYARQKHQAVLLSDGQVAIIGGTSNSAPPPPGPSKTIEIYDPTSGEFSKSIVPMTRERTSPAAALMPDGRVYIVGGNSDGAPEIFDPFKGSSSVTRPPGFNYSLFSVAATLDINPGKVLFIEGANANNNPVELYTASTNLISSGTSLPTQIFDSFTLTALPGGRYVVAGGTTSNTSVGGVLISDVNTSVNTPLFGGDDRAGHTANLMPDEKTVILLGGYVYINQTIYWGNTAPDGTECNNDAEDDCPYSFDTLTASADTISTDSKSLTRKSIAGLKSARFKHTSTLLQSGTLLIVGGADLASTQTVNTPEYYPAP